MFKAGAQVPVMPLLEVVGNADKVAPEQIGATVLNVGVMFGFTVTVNVVPATHPAEVGVNTYVPELFGSTTAGAHMPVMPLVDMFDKTGTDPLVQIEMDVPNGKVAITFGITVMEAVTGTPQVPAAGVNVYVPLVVLLTTVGLQVPLMPLLDVAGKTGAGEPSQKDAMELKRGTAIGLDNCCPVNTFEILPLKSNIKLTYLPAFKPVMVNCPAAVEVMVTGPVITPSSVYVTRYVVLGVSPLNENDPSEPLHVEGLLLISKTGSSVL